MTGSSLPFITLSVLILVWNQTAMTELRVLRDMTSLISFVAVTDEGFSLCSFWLQIILGEMSPMEGCKPWEVLCTDLKPFLFSLVRSCHDFHLALVYENLKTLLQCIKA